MARRGAIRCTHINGHSEANTLEQEKLASAQQPVESGTPSCLVFHIQALSIASRALANEVRDAHEALDEIGERMAGRKRKFPFGAA